MNIKQIALLFMVILTIACTPKQENETPKAVKFESAIEEEKSQANHEQLVYKESVFDIPTLMTLYVINEHGTGIYEEADINSSVLDKLVYGADIEVIEERAEWYVIKRQITKEYQENGRLVTSSIWEKVYVLKSDIGDIQSVKLTKEQLYKTIQNDSISDFLALDIITKGEYENTSRISRNPIVKKLELVDSVDAVLTVKLGSQEVKNFVSTPNAEESMSIYRYIGHIDSLEIFILFVGYYEGGEFVAYSSASGEQVLTFNSYPNFSLDGNKIISIYTNPYDASTDIELYQVSKKRIEKITGTRFINWMAAVEDGTEIKWLNNETLALKVIHSNAFWDESGDLNDDYEYLRIKIR